MNRPARSDLQARVAAVYPDARCWFSYNTDRFQVSATVDGRWTELTAEWETETMAWTDALAKVVRDGDAI